MTPPHLCSESVLEPWAGERRLFMAFACNGPERAQLLALQQRLQPYEPDMVTAPQWVLAENLHLTVRFFGQMTYVQARTIAAQVDAMQQQGMLTTAVFQLHKLAVWPGPNILCVEAGCLAADVVALQHAIECGAQQLGCTASEYAWTPHITLARKGKSLAASVQTFEFSTLGFQPKQLVLYHSMSTPDGVRYRPLLQWSVTSSNYSG